MVVHLVCLCFFSYSVCVLFQLFHIRSLSCSASISDCGSSSLLLMLTRLFHLNFPNCFDHVPLVIMLVFLYMFPCVSSAVLLEAGSDVSHSTRAQAGPQAVLVQTVSQEVRQLILPVAAQPHSPRHQALPL